MANVDLEQLRKDRVYDLAFQMAVKQSQTGIAPSPNLNKISWSELNEPDIIPTLYGVAIFDWNTRDRSMTEAARLGRKEGYLEGLMAFWLNHQLADEHSLNRQVLEDIGVYGFIRGLALQPPHADIITSVSLYGLTLKANQVEARFVRGYQAGVVTTVAQRWNQRLAPDEVPFDNPSARKFTRGLNGQSYDEIMFRSSSDLSFLDELTLITGSDRGRYRAAHSAGARIRREVSEVAKQFPPLPFSGLEGWKTPPTGKSTNWSNSDISTLYPKESQKLIKRFIDPDDLRSQKINRLPFPPESQL